MKYILSLVCALLTLFNTNNVQQKEIKYNNHLTSLDTTLVNTYKPTSNLLNDLTTVAPINSLYELNKYSVIKAKPGSIILKIDEEMNLVNQDNQKINISLIDAYNQYIKGKMIPLIYISDIEIANNFIEFYPSNMNILDMAVISDNPNIVKKIRENNTVIRGILDYSNQSIDANNLGEIVKDINLAYANTIILNSEYTTREVVNYIQARTKSVWVKVNNFTNIEILKQINNGVYGIVTSNVDGIYALSNVYQQTDNPLYNLTRKPYSIAHRGVLNNYENSLEGFIEAIELGATHIELDVQVTKDNKLVLMHDSSIDRTTTGSGSVGDYTLEELKNFKIDSTPEGETLGTGVNIPTLDEILEYTITTDVVTVIEIKTYNTNVVSLIRESLEKYDAFDNVIIISFYPSQIEKVQSLIPEVPLCSLANVSYLSLAEDLQRMAKMNSGVNTTKDNSYKDLTRYLTARGYASWHWTYIDDEDFNKGISLGVNGLTNDCVEKLSDFAYELISLDEEIITSKEYEYLDISLHYKTYQGISKEQIKAKPLYIEEHDGYAFVIFYSLVTNCDTYQYIIFSKPIKVFNN